MTAQAIMVTAMAKTGRRGFFGRALGGFAAALGLAKVAPEVFRAFDCETGVMVEFDGWPALATWESAAPMRWDGMIYPPEGGEPYNYAVSDAVVEVNIPAPVRLYTEDGKPGPWLVRAK